PTIGRAPSPIYLTEYIGCGLLRAMLSGRRVCLLSRSLPLAAAALGWTLPARAQVVVKVNDAVYFRFGIVLQGWADWTEDPVTEGYAQTLFLRRIRVIVAGAVAPNVSFFFQTDNPRLGNAGLTGAKTLNTGFLTQDAFAEWKIAGDALMLDAGLFYTPQ